MLLTSPFVFFGAYKADCNTSGLTQWLPENDQRRETYDWFRRQFQSDELVLVTWSGCMLDSPVLQRFAQELERRSGILATPEEPRLFNEIIVGSSQVERLMGPPLRLPRPVAIQRLQGILIGPASISKNRDDDPGDHLNDQNVTSTEPASKTSGGSVNGWPTCLVISLTPHGLDNQRRVITVIRQIAAEVAGVESRDLKIGGRVYEAATMDEKAEQSVKDYIVPITFVSVAIVWYCLRSVPALIAISLIASYCRLLTLALIYYSGAHMSSVLIISPLLVYVLSVSACLHLANHYFLSPASATRAESAMLAMRAVWKPCTLAALTSGLGLISLSVSRIWPIREFGQYSTVALLLALPVVLFCLPGLLIFASPAGSNAPSSNSQHCRRQFVTMLSVLAESVLHHRRWLVTSILMTVLVFGLGLTRLQTTINFNGMFSSSSEINRNYAWIERSIGALGSIEALLCFPADSQMRLLDRMKLVAEIDRATRAMPGIHGVYSAATFAPVNKQATGSMRVLQNAVIRKRLPGILRSERLLADDATGEHWRIQLRVEALRDDDYRHTMNAVKQRIEAILNADPTVASSVSLRLTGLVAMIDVAQEVLLADLFSSYLCAFGVIVVVMMTALRSVRAGIIAMIPNFAPTAFIFGMMGWMRWKVDIACVLTASVALGVALDDTLHFLSWFRRSVQNGHSRDAAIRLAMAQCGPAMIQTTLVCGLGLLVLAQSDFMPTRRFATLQTLLLFAALFCDLVLLPAMLATRLGRYFVPHTKAVPQLSQ